MSEAGATPDNDVSGAGDASNELPDLNVVCLTSACDCRRDDSSNFVVSVELHQRNLGALHSEVSVLP